MLDVMVIVTLPGSVEGFERGGTFDGAATVATTPGTAHATPAEMELGATGRCGGVLWWFFFVVKEQQSMLL